METFHNLKVFKKPRSNPLLDIPINFPSFKNLHLELMEIKEKLKKNLPLIPISKPTLPAKVAETESSEDEKNMKSGPIVQPPPGEIRDAEEKKNKHSKKKDKKSKKDKRKEKYPKIDKNAKADKKAVKHAKKHDPVVADLGESTESDSSSDDSSESESDSGTKSGSSTEGASSGSKTGDENSTGESGSSPSGAEKEPEEEDDPYAGLSPEEREIKEKEEYIWRFRILKKQYGKNASIPIPEWNEHSDLTLMKTSYERTIKELYLDDAVETYRTYLLGGWMVMEYVCTQVIGIDLRGFTVQQSKMMYKYDRMLIELGEKSYTRWGMNLPVEIRLLGLILFQAGIFYLGKVLADKFGNSAAEMFKGFTGQPPDATPPQNASPNAQTGTETSSAPPKSRMRGPKISSDDIRNRNKPE